MDQPQTILIVTSELDPHADTVIRALRKMGQNLVRLHPADFPLKVQTTLELKQEHWQGHIDLPHHDSLELEAIRSVWWRRPNPIVLPDGLSQNELIYAQREAVETLNGIWDSLDCYWMNFPSYNRRASNKIDQLRRAAQLGLAIPRTLITNDPEQARDFYDACKGQVIYKNLGSPTIGKIGSTVLHETQSHSPQMVYTTALTPEHLELLEAVRTTPCQFQELIAKRFELRITIIGEELFTCEIHSQEHERTRLDWRHYDVRIPYRKGVLPPDIADKCFALTRGYGLNFAAIDMIVTPAGQYVFLELNPNGQWLFVEEFVPELKMVDALTACLMRGHN